MPSRKIFPLRPDVPKPAPAACQCGAARVTPLPDESGAAPARLAHLYLCEGLSTYGIAQLTGLDRQRVTRLLHRSGVPLRPRGAGGTRPGQRRPDPPYLGLVLAELYVGQRLSTPQIGEMLGLPDRRVRERLREYGIQARTRGGWQREDRRALPAEALQLLYHVQGLSADDVGRKFGTSRKAVLRTAHDLGLPVRTGGTVAPSGPDEIQAHRRFVRRPAPNRRPG